MSLTTEITALTSAARDLTQRVDGWVADADARITAAIRAIPQLSMRIYVHSGMGDDTAPGSADEPVASVAEAVRRMPASSQLAIYLLDDLVIDEPIDARHLLRLAIVGDGQRRALSFGAGYQTFWDGHRLDGLACRREALMVNLDIQYPAATASPPADRPIIHTGLIHMDGGYLSLWGCTISGTAPSSPVERYVIDPKNYAYIVMGGATSWQSSVASHLIKGVAAGGDPNALWNVRSNITQV